MPGEPTIHASLKRLASGLVDKAVGTPPKAALEAALATPEGHLIMATLVSVPGWTRHLAEQRIDAMLLAALPPVAPDGADLDVAWAEAEAALPESDATGAWSILMGDGRSDPNYGYWATASHREEAGGLTIIGGKRDDHYSTPAAALRELARRLRADEG